jgi:MtN3 and saliva related transmembrane protein
MATLALAKKSRQIQLHCIYKNRFMNITTLLGLAAACLTTASFIPQALKTIKTKNTTGISLSMYAVFTAGTFLWLVYGLFGRDIPIVAANGITLVFAGIILAFKLKYK